MQCLWFVITLCIVTIMFSKGRGCPIAWFTPLRDFESSCLIHFFFEPSLLFCTKSFHFAGGVYQWFIVGRCFCTESKNANVDVSFVWAEEQQQHKVFLFSWSALILNEYFFIFSSNNLKNISEFSCCIAFGSSACVWSYLWQYLVDLQVLLDQLLL